MVCLTEQHFPAAVQIQSQVQKAIAYLIDRIKENQIQAVFYLELSSHRTADIISEETGAKPLLLHSCHNVTRRQFDEGVTYLQLMKQNAKKSAGSTFIGGMIKNGTIDQM